MTDFGEPRSLREAFSGVEVLVHAAAHYPRLSLEPQQTLDRGLCELEAVLDAAAEAGVRRLVFVSSTATVAPREDGLSTEDDVFTTCPDWGTYHALKWHLERRVRAEHRMEMVVACPAACLGPFDWKVGTSALLVATARGAPPAHPIGRITTVDARDVAHALVLLATAAHPPSRLLLADETSDAHELLCGLARRYGAPAPPPALCADRARALSNLQEEDAARFGGRPALARELVDLIVHGPRIDASRSRALGIRYRPLNDTLDAWDSWAQRMGLLPTSRLELRT
ncbi:MAG: NAD-dependent epimerase/dehydratase family protein [Archangium sp.]|nr:NAD-dependent epimerase/dehydratase family protein [Archangium sp.]MDP3574029.1 NAD-dependent epimerase/dehydratase family protein [Archangium sp.]